MFCEETEKLLECVLEVILSKKVYIHHRSIWLNQDIDNFINVVTDENDIYIIRYL